MRTPRYTGAAIRSMCMAENRLRRALAKIDARIEHLKSELAQVAAAKAAIAQNEARASSADKPL